MTPMQLKTNSKKLTQPLIKPPSSDTIWAEPLPNSLQKNARLCRFYLGTKRPSADFFISPKLVTAQIITNLGRHMDTAVIPNNARNPYL